MRSVAVALVASSALAAQYATFSPYLDVYTNGADCTSTAPVLTVDGVQSGGVLFFCGTQLCSPHQKCAGFWSELATRTLRSGPTCKVVGLLTRDALLSCRVRPGKANLEWSSTA